MSAYRIGLMGVIMILAASGCGTGGAPDAGAVSQKASASPILDPASAAFANMVNNDVNALDFQVYKKFDCKSRDACTSELRDIRTLVVSLLNDLDRTPPPTLFVKQAGAVTRAARAFLALVDSTLALMVQPNSNYVAESGAIDVHPLDIASGAIVCWPKLPEPLEGGEFTSGYVCVDAAHFSTSVPNPL